MFIDCHQDIAYSILSNKRDFKTKSEKYMITFDNLKDSNLDIIFSTIFVSHRREEKHKEEASLQIEEYNKIFQNFPDDFYHIQNKDELRQPKGKIGLIFLMEGAEPISSVDDVDLFYELGLRILGLTWNNENKYAFGSDKDGSLNTEGYELIEKMNEKNITLDLSHLSEKSFWDCIEKTNLIPIASHSNSSKIRKHKRNLNDEQLNKWGEEYSKWTEENKHLPNLLPVETILERFKQRRDGVNNPPSNNQQPNVVTKSISPEAEARITRVEQKLDKLMKHLGVK